MLTSLALFALLSATPHGEVASSVPGEPGGPTLYLAAAKVLTAEWRGPGFIDQGAVIVKDGRIVAVGRRAELAVPAGAVVEDMGDDWLMPGIVELHCHIAGAFGLNDTVYLTNPGLRASSDVIAGNEALDVGMAAGVTTVLYIPGSGTNVGGQGVLLRSGFDHYEDAEVRNPGSLKLAQAGNPERWMLRPNRSLMNWNTRDTFVRGITYAKAWEQFEAKGGDAPVKDPQWEIFRALRKNEAQVSTHTQIYQVVLQTLTTIHDALGIPVFIDHGTFDGWRTGKLVKERGIFAILGPRAIDVPEANMVRWSGSNPERIQGCAAGYQEQGVELIGFNTDSPVIPQEELPLQAAMGVRYGFKNESMQAVKGLTIVPAMAVGLDAEVGSIEAGKSADLLRITGDPADPRCWVKQVWQKGVRTYNAADRRLW
ncbi:MAG: amidohydrolase family protein [Planctomycetota bacterium]